MFLLPLLQLETLPSWAALAKTLRAGGEHDDDDPLLYVAQKLLYDFENTVLSDEERWELFFEAIHQPRTEGEDY